MANDARGRRPASVEELSERTIRGVSLRGRSPIKFNFQIILNYFRQNIFACACNQSIFRDLAQLENVEFPCAGLTYREAIS